MKIVILLLLLIGMAQASIGGTGYTELTGPYTTFSSNVSEQDIKTGLDLVIQKLEGCYNTTTGIIMVCDNSEAVCNAGCNATRLYEYNARFTIAFSLANAVWYDLYGNETRLNNSLKSLAAMQNLTKEKCNVDNWDCIYTQNKVSEPVNALIALEKEYQTIKILEEMGELSGPELAVAQEHFRNVTESIYDWHGSGQFAAINQQLVEAWTYLDYYDLTGTTAYLTRAQEILDYVDVSNSDGTYTDLTSGLPENGYLFVSAFHLFPILNNYGHLVDITDLCATFENLMNGYGFHLMGLSDVQSATLPIYDRTSVIHDPTLALYAASVSPKSDRMSTIFHNSWEIYKKRLASGQYGTYTHYANDAGFHFSNILYGKKHQSSNYKLDIENLAVLNYTWFSASYPESKLSFYAQDNSLMTAMPSCYGDVYNWTSGHGYNGWSASYLYPTILPAKYTVRTTNFADLNQDCAFINHTAKVSNNVIRGDINITSDGGLHIKRWFIPTEKGNVILNAIYSNQQGGAADTYQYILERASTFHQTYDGYNFTIKNSTGYFEINSSGDAANRKNITELKIGNTRMRVLYTNFDSSEGPRGYRTYTTAHDYSDGNLYNTYPSYTTPDNPTLHMTLFGSNNSVGSPAYTISDNLFAIQSATSPLNKWFIGGINNDTGEGFGSFTTNYTDLWDTVNQVFISRDNFTKTINITTDTILYATDFNFSHFATIEDTLTVLYDTSGKVIDDELPVWIASNDGVSVHIDSNLTETINATVTFNVESCLISSINYTSHTGAHSKIYTPSEWTCSGGQVTLDITGIEQASGSNGLVVSYGEGVIYFKMSDDGAGGYGLSLSNTSHPLVRIGNGSANEITGTSPVPNGQWTHLAAVYNGTHVNLFVNGVLTDSIAHTGSVSATANPWAIGCAMNSTACNEGYFNGIIDEVTILNRSLTAEEILVQYQNGRNNRNLAHPPVLASSEKIYNSTETFVSGADYSLNDRTGAISLYNKTGTVSANYTNIPAGTSTGATSAILNAVPIIFAVLLLIGAAGALKLYTR